MCCYVLINTLSFVSHNRLVSAGMPVVFDKAAFPRLLDPYRLHVGTILTFHWFMLRAVHFSVLGVDNHTLGDFLKCVCKVWYSFYYYISTYYFIIIP